MIVTANTLPVFVAAPVALSTPAGVWISYTIPGTYDAESHPVTISISAGGPTFITFTAPNILNISPALTDVGTGSV